MYFYCFEIQISDTTRSLGGGGGVQIFISAPLSKCPHGRIQRGETGKSQVIWVSIGNKQLDTTTPPPLEEVGLPPPPGICWTSSGVLEKDSFL